jgi:hypothetical protein
MNYNLMVKNLNLLLVTVYAFIDLRHTLKKDSLINSQMKYLKLVKFYKHHQLHMNLIDLHGEPIVGKFYSNELIRTEF